MQITILIPLPATDFDPTESAIPWKILKDEGISVCFATPEGKTPECDLRILNGTGLGPTRAFLMADQNARTAYEKMSKSAEFLDCLSWDKIDSNQFDGLILPGGHAKGMKPYLESTKLQDVVAEFFGSNKPVGAICHGVVLAARSKINGQSVLKGRRTTALLAVQEFSAWLMTCLWLGSYYRTYPQSVEAEVRSSLANSSDFLKGPTPLSRDSLNKLNRGFIVRDGNYVSARWPGDAHKFAVEFVKLIKP